MLLLSTTQNSLDLYIQFIQRKIKEKTLSFKSFQSLNMKSECYKIEKKKIDMIIYKGKNGVKNKNRNEE